MADLMLSAAFQKIRETRDVCLDIGVRVFEAVSYPRLGCQVKNGLKRVSVESVPEHHFIFEGAFNKCKPFILFQQGEPVQF